MSKKKTSGNSKRDFYSDDMTKAVIGNLFAEYAAEDGKNYFVSDSSKRRNADVEPEEIEEILEEPEIEEIEEAEAEEEEVEVYVPRRNRNKQKQQPESEVKEKKKGLFSIFINEDEYDDEEEEIELPKKSIRETVEERGTEPKSEKPQIPRFMQEFAGENDFFDDEDDEEEEVIELPIGRIAIVVGAVLIVALIAWLGTTRAGFKNQLEEANLKIEELNKLNTSSTYESEIATLKSQVNELIAENERLKNTAVTVSGAEMTDEASEEGDISDDAETSDENSGDEEINQNSADNSSYTIYTLKAGDYPFAISEEVYGDGSRYKEILEFNNITAEEFSDLGAGTELKIPN